MVVLAREFKLPLPLVEGRGVPPPTCIIWAMMSSKQSATRSDWAQARAGYLPLLSTAKTLAPLDSRISVTGSIPSFAARWRALKTGSYRLLPVLYNIVIDCYQSCIT